MPTPGGPRDPQEFLGNAYAADDYEKVDDILDVWFESGCTHATVLEQRPELQWPASLYLEGSDQHRGWFHSSLLESCGTRGRAPYEAVLTHGFVVDADGRKMSKSLGNVVSPIDLMKTHGADILRLWVVSGDYTEDLRIGKAILDGIADTYRRLRNTLRYLLGNLAGFTEAERLPHAQMPELERWVLHRLAELDEQVRGLQRASSTIRGSYGPAARISAPTTCRRSTSTSARTRSIATPSTASAGAPRAPCSTSCSAASPPGWRRCWCSPTEEAWLTRFPDEAQRPSARCSPTLPRRLARRRRWARAGSGSARCAAWSPVPWSWSARRSGSAPACRRRPRSISAPSRPRAAGRARSRRARDHQRHRARRRRRPRRTPSRSRMCRAWRWCPALAEGEKCAALLAGPARGRGVARASVPPLHGCRRHRAGGLSAGMRMRCTGPLLALAVLVARPGHQMAGAGARSTPTSRSRSPRSSTWSWSGTAASASACSAALGDHGPWLLTAAGRRHRRLPDRLALPRDPPVTRARARGWCWPARSATAIDRLRFGAVVDFLDFHAFGYHWPAFNVADSAIVIGAGLILLDSLVLSQTRTKLGRGEG